MSRPRKSKATCSTLAALAKADGHVDDREMNFIITVGKKNGVSAGDVRKIVDGRTTNTSDLPHTDSERFDQIFDLVDMMLADGTVDETEMDFCINMAEKLGFRKAIVGVLVRKNLAGCKGRRTPRAYQRRKPFFLELQRLAEAVI